jgi:hypothetical protein
MAKLPKQVTWMISTEPGRTRSLCIEGSSPKRLASFERRHTVAVVTRPLGQAWDGTTMSPNAMKVLTRGIYRAMKRNPTQVVHDELPSDAGAGHLILGVADSHGIEMIDLLDPPNRTTKYTRARGHAVHLLKGRLGLSLTQIANLLGYSDPSTVRYWLNRRFEFVSRSGKRRINDDHHPFEERVNEERVH